MEHKVKLVATEGMFRGLAKQNMLFHQCVCELVDNGIAAAVNPGKFRIDVVFHQPQGGSESWDMYIADNGAGMDADHLMRALQLGQSASEDNRLNEHGFGLKNALATLTGGAGPWKLWSRKPGSPAISSATGPFRPDMIVLDDDSFPTLDILPPDISTLVHVKVSLRFMQTLQGRGAPSTNANTLREWLVEHLGVLYRGYLEQDAETFETSGSIIVSIGTDSIQVPPIAVPFSDAKTEYLEVTLGGKVYKLEYRFGTLDVVKRERSVKGKKAKYYYQQNIPTQGIDIRLGKRVIATRQLDTVWKTENGKTQLARHNNFNDFVGELLIPELPRGVLTTVNTKTDFNLDDPEWAQIFEILNRDFRPPKQIREKSEAELKRKWLEMLKATSPDDTVTDEHSVWPTATAIDVYRKTSIGRIIIYELKVGAGAPLDLYQLKMYWDGLVLSSKEQPSEAILLCEEFSTSLEEMANMMNKLPVQKGSKPYNFKIETLASKQLREH